MTLPRNSVFPMNWAIWAKTRLLTPLSPLELRSPSCASASSTTTAIGLMARSKARTRSRLPSVTPCHMLRKFLSMTAGIPTSPAKQVVRNVLPGAHRPADDVAHGQHVGPPERGSPRRRPAGCFLAASWPATNERSKRLWMNSSMPPDSASMSSFLRWRRNSMVSGCRFCTDSEMRLCNVDALQAGRELRERASAHVGARRQRRRRQRPADELQPLAFVGKRDLDAGDPGVLHDAGMEFDLALGDEANGHVGLQEGGIRGPALEDHQRVAVLGRHCRRRRRPERWSRRSRSPGRASSGREPAGAGSCRAASAPAPGSAAAPASSTRCRDSCRSRPARAGSRPACSGRAKRIPPPRS